MINYNEAELLEGILNSVTKEDEEKIFVSLEYLKDYKGIVLGDIHDDWFGNVFEVWENVNKFEGDDENSRTYWTSFEEAKGKLEYKGSGAKVMRLKEGLVVAFQHKMMLADLTSEEPEFAREYDKALDLWHEYRKQFVSREEEQARLREIGLAGFQAIKNLFGDTK